MAVPVVTHASDILYPGAERAHFLSQVADVHINGSVNDVLFIAPETVQQFLPGKDPSGFFSQGCQDDQLGFGGVNILPIHPHGKTVLVDLQTFPEKHDPICVVRYGRLCFLAPRLVAADQRPDPGNKLAGGKGFDQVVIRSQFQAQDLVMFLSACSEHQDGHGAQTGVLTETATDLQSVQIGEHQIKQDGLRQGVTAFQEGEHGFTGTEIGDAVPCLAQMKGDQFQDVGLIVHTDDQGF
mgnify:CR=1 FL=1